MNEQNIEQRIARLTKEIIRHNELYYRRAEPEISDLEYDILKEELASLEAQHPNLIRSDSPTRRVGDDRLAGFQSYRHRLPMLSLDNTYSRDELIKFDKRMRRLLGKDSLDYIVEPKIDGVAVSLTFEKGQLRRAVTRGNGIEGDDITQNVLTIKNLPGRLIGENLPNIVEIRGEIFMSLAEFERINTERAERGETLYANPRNLAAGTVKQLDPREVARRKLDIVLHGPGYCEPQIFNQQNDFHEAIRSWKLPTVDKYWRAAGIDEAWECIQKLDTMRNQFPFATDGAVIKLDSFAGQDEAGATSKAPRWAIAYKFAPEQAETRLREITIQVGRTGALTPVAELDPVTLDGTTVSRATLHNADEIARKDFREGDWVVVEKAGEIIPAVIRVIPDKRPADSRPYVFPANCPACGAEAIRLPDEAAWRCPNLNCPPQVRRRIGHFASRYCLDIDGLGKAAVDQLVGQGLIRNIADLYGLQSENLMPLDKFAQKSADNLVRAIADSKNREMWRLLHGLGIQHVGTQAAKDLARHFKSLRALLEADEEILTSVDGVGETMAKSIRSFFVQKANLETIHRLFEAGLNTELDPAEDQVSETLAGKNFVLTGALPHMTRDEARELIERAGGKVTAGVSKKIDYVLAGSTPGSKFEKAQKLGVTIIDEAGLRSLLAD